MPDESVVVGGRVTNFQGVTRDFPIHISKYGRINSDFLINPSYPNGIVSNLDIDYTPIMFFNFEKFSILSKAVPLNYLGSKKANIVILNPL